MKELNVEEVKDLLEFDFSGLIVGVPANSNVYNAELYIYGSRINSKNKREITMMCYNMEDGTCDGFAALNITNIAEHFKNDNDVFCTIKYYLFDNLLEFCSWYIHKDDKLKKSVKDFKETTRNSSLYSIPITDSKELEHLNKLISTESQKAYEHKKKVCYFEQKYGFNPYEEDAPEELGYLEIYIDSNCDAELKEIIEKKYPKIKDLFSKMQEGKLLCAYTYDEIRQKLSPRWNTRKEQLKDVLKLLELRDLRQNTIDMMKESTSDINRYHLQQQLNRDEKRIEAFLNEKVY